MALRSQHLALKSLHLALKSRHLALKSRHFALKSRHLALKSRHLALQSRHLALKSRHLALKSRHLALKSRHLALKDRHLALIASWCKRVRTHGANIGLYINSFPRDTVAPPSPHCGLRSLAAPLAAPAMATALTADQAKKLATKLAQRVRDGDTESEVFRTELQAFASFRKQQADSNVKIRKGKHTAELDPFIAALPSKQRALGTHVSLEHDRTREAVQNKIEAEHAGQHRRHDQTQRQIQELHTALVPVLGPDEANSTPEQLRKRKASVVEHFDARIARAKARASELQKLKPVELRARLAEANLDTTGSKATLVRRLQNSGAQTNDPGGSNSPTSAAEAPDNLGANALDIARAEGQRVATPELRVEPCTFATPLSEQRPEIATLLRDAQGLVRSGALTPASLERYFAALRQHYEPYRPQMPAVETLSFAQAKALCPKLGLKPPASFAKLDEVRACILKQRTSYDELRIAHFLAEQASASTGFLAKQRRLLNVGSLVRHVSRTVVETAMVIAPVVFHDAAASGEIELALAYRVYSLDDMKPGYAKSIKDILLRAPETPWVPARMETWTPPQEADEFVRQADAGKCFTSAEDLRRLACTVGLPPAPGAKHEQMKLQLCTWAAQSCLDHARRQLAGRVLYELVAASPAREYVEIPATSPVWAGSEAKRWYDAFCVDVGAAEASDVEAATPPAKRRRIDAKWASGEGGGGQTESSPVATCVS